MSSRLAAALILALSPGSVAAPVIQATGRLRLADRLSSGLLGCSGLCRSGVRTKVGIDMVLLGSSGSPGRLRRGEPAQVGDGAGQSPRVDQ